MSSKTYKKHSELFNTLSHSIATVLAIPAVVVLLVFASLKGDPWRIVSFSVYGTTLVLLYLFSSLYHGSNGRIKKLFQKLDHIGIYLLIAGSYTPFTLTVLNGAWGWSLFGVVWLLALTGIIIDTRHKHGPRGIQMAIYFTMGWLMLVAIYPLSQAMPLGGVSWVVIGGILYTVGIIFYAREKQIRYGHGIWHLFVIGGSACHYFTIFYYLL